MATQKQVQQLVEELQRMSARVIAAEQAASAAAIYASSCSDTKATRAPRRRSCDTTRRHEGFGQAS
eukprot:2972546-Amphidinium_carterae.1